MGRRVRTLLGGPALLALALLSGCSGCGGCHPNPEAYPVTINFAPRTDWIVVELPKDAPAGEDPPGEIEEAIRRANQHGGRVLDPAARKHGPGRDLLVRLERLARGETDEAPRPAPAPAPPVAHTPPALTDSRFDTHPGTDRRRQDLLLVAAGLSVEPLPAGHGHHTGTDALGCEVGAGPATSDEYELRF